MKDATLIAVDSVMRADGTISVRVIEDVLNALKRNPDKRRLGTVRAAAEILSCHPRTVHRYARRGLLHPVKITCRRIRFDLNEVERLASEGAAA